MRLPIVLSAIATVAILLGALQQRELKQLKTSRKELASDLSRLERVQVESKAASVQSEAITAKPNPSKSAENGGSITLKAMEFVNQTEELIASDSRVEAAVRLTPILALASPELLKEILLQFETSKLGQTEKYMAWQVILGKLVKREPVEAVRLALENSPDPKTLFPEILQAWLKRDFATAEAWYLAAKADGTIPSEPAQLSIAAEAAIFGFMVRRNMPAALELLAKPAIPESSRVAMFKGVQQSITSVKKWKQLAQFATSAEDPVVRRGTLEILAARSFEHGTIEEKLARIDDLSLEEGELSLFAVNAIRSTLHYNSPPLADWALPRLPEELVQQEVGHLIAGWSRTYRPGVEAWVESLPEGETKEFARERLGK